jgi:MFS family permease
MQSASPAAVVDRPASEPNRTAIDRHNARQLFGDIFCFGILAGSAQAFLAVYMARIGASAFQVGLLTAAPAVVSLLVSLPAARLMEGRSLVRVSVQTALWMRLGYVGFVFLPVLFAEQAQSWAILALIVLMAVPGAALVIAFNAMFADVVPPATRALVVGRRNALLAVSMMGTSVFSGWLLDTVAYPLNYQIVFGLGVLGGALSTYFLTRLKPVPAPTERLNQPLLDMARPGSMRFLPGMRPGAGLRFLTRGQGGALLRLELLRGPFGVFLLVLFCFYVAQFTPFSIVPLVLVHTLALPDGAISIGNALFHGCTLLVSMRLHAVSTRLGNQRVLALSALVFGVYPLLIGQAHGAPLFWIASAAGGAVWGLAGGALITRLMERVPDHDRPAHMALHSLALNLGALTGSLLGPVLGDVLGLRQAMMTSAAMRLAAGLLLVVWG